MNPSDVKRVAVRLLNERGQKPDLSPQAVAVIDAICEVLSKCNKHTATNGAYAPTPLPMKELTNAWEAGWEKRFGGPYKFNGAADGKAAADLLKLGLAPDYIMSVARRAWDQPEEFNCKHAMTLRGLAGRWNEIRAAVGAVNGNGHSRVTAAGVDRRTGERVFMP